MKIDFYVVLVRESGMSWSERITTNSSDPAKALEQWMRKYFFTTSGEIKDKMFYSKKDMVVVTEFCNGQRNGRQTYTLAEVCGL